MKLRHTEIILRQALFQRGVADMRAGRTPRFDTEIGTNKCLWLGREGRPVAVLYEWGRQFGAVAPRDLPLMIAHAANPAAIALLKTCFDNGTLIVDLDLSRVSHITRAKRTRITSYHTIGFTPFDGQIISHPTNLYEELLKHADALKAWNRNRKSQKE